MLLKGCYDINSLIKVADNWVQKLPLSLCILCFSRPAVWTQSRCANACHPRSAQGCLLHALLQHNWPVQALEHFGCCCSTTRRVKQKPLAIQISHTKHKMGTFLKLKSYRTAENQYHQQILLQSLEWEFRHATVLEEMDQELLHVCNKWLAPPPQTSCSAAGPAVADVTDSWYYHINTVFCRTVGSQLAAPVEQLEVRCLPLWMLEGEKALDLSVPILLL